MGGPAASRVLGLLFLVSGVMAWAGALHPMSPGTPVGLLEGLGVVGLGMAAPLLLAPGRGGTGPLHLGLALLSAAVALLAWRSATALGVVGLGTPVVCLGLYAAHFLPMPAARLHVTGAIVAVTAGAVASPATPPAQVWVLTVVAALLVTEVQGRLVRSLHRAALTDELTGLPNRRAWLDATDRSVAAAGRRGSAGPTVVVIDLDGFKAVNDLEGHAAGDRLLRDLAGAWTSALRRCDLLARHGGDEFALLLDQPVEVAAVLARLRAAHPAGWSAGVAQWRPGDTTDALLVRADADLYDRKARCPPGRGTRRPSGRPARGASRRPALSEA